jgi:RNA polymerase sigma factor (sigma-70 family)
VAITNTGNHKSWIRVKSWGIVRFMTTPQGVGEEMSSGPAADAEAVSQLEGSHPDAELVRAILQKDRKATAELVLLYSDAIYAYVRRRLFPRADLADDIVQDVFVAALDGLAAFAGNSSLRTWLLGIARHKVEDYYRECLKQPLPLSDLQEHGDEPEQPESRYEEMLDETNRQHRVMRVLSSLPELYRTVLLWRYWERQSARDMAAASGKTEKSIERLLARARREFRHLWNEDKA